MTENQSSKDSHRELSKKQRGRSVEDFETLLAELHSIEVETIPMSPKRPRRTYDDKELQKLESVFALRQFPDRNHRNQLAKEMNVSPKNIQIWFQNRRARERLLRRKAEGIVQNPIDRMRIQLAQSPHYVQPRFPTINSEIQQPVVTHESSSHSIIQKQDRRPITDITNFQSVMQLGTSHQQSHNKCDQQFEMGPILEWRNSLENSYQSNPIVGASFEQLINEDFSNSQETLPQNCQQGPESNSLPSEMQMAVVSPRHFQTSVFSISNLEINENFSKSQESLHQNCQQGPGSYSMPSEMQMAVVTPRHFRTSLLSISNLSEMNENFSNSQESLPQNCQQGPGSYSIQSEMQMAVMSPRRFRTSLLSISNISEINENFSNSQESLPQNCQQGPGSYSIQSEMQMAVMSPRRFRTSLLSISNISEINEDFSNSQETLPQNCQQGPGSYSMPSEMQMAVGSPRRFRASLLSISNLSEMNENFSNSQETLTQNCQQGPGSYSMPSEMHMAVLSPRRFRTSVFSFSNLSEISNSSFSNMLEATTSIDDENFTNISPSCDFVFEF